jgi:hypothetical protein
VIITPQPLDRRARARMEVIAIGFAIGVIVLVALIALTFPKETFHITGSPVPLSIAAVRPDEREQLYDVEGKKVDDVAFDRRYTRTWPTNMLRRDFIFNLPVGVRIQPVGYQVQFGGQWQSAAENFLEPVFTTGRTYTLVTTFTDSYYHSSMFFSSSLPVEFVDVTLSFYLPERGQPALTFKGPFVDGVTNTARSTTQQWWKCDLVLEGRDIRAGVTNTPFRSLMTMGFLNNGALTFLDRNGRRHFAQITNTSPNAGSWIWRGYVPGVLLKDIASAEVHLPEEKTFHHVRVRYPGQPQQSAPASGSKP